MNVEGYNLDSLRRLVRDLQEENKNLRELLKQKNIPCESEHAFQEEGRHPEKLDPDQGGMIQQVFITDKMVQWFYSMFWGRTDVYAKR